MLRLIKLDDMKMIVYSALLSHKQALKRSCTQQPAVYIQPLSGVWHRAG